MSSHPEIVAETLQYLDSLRQSPTAIDEAYIRRDLGMSDLVMTSMGNSRKAVITPAYPAFQYEPRLLQRLDWAATLRRPFIEASIGVEKDTDYRGEKILKMATVTLRSCVSPSLNGYSTVLQSCARFSLDADARYGTMESVIEDIVLYAENGEGLEQSGYVNVPPPDQRSKKGKWSLSERIPEYDRFAMDEALYYQALGLEFVTNL